MKRILLLCLAAFSFAECSSLSRTNGIVDPSALRDLPPVSPPPVRPNVAYLRFFAIGDMGTGSQDQHAIARAMARRATESGLDFILTVGDNIYPVGVFSALDPQWKTKFEDVYDAPPLQVDYFPTLGNHDHIAIPEAQVHYSEKNKQWKMPGFYYTVSKKIDDSAAVQFFAIDTDTIIRRRPGAQAQVEWLDRELARSQAKWKIVYGHHPIYSHGPHGGSKIMMEQVKPLVDRHKVDVFLAGHDHTLELIRPDAGATYVIAGAAGGAENAYSIDWSDESLYAATLGGFVSFRLASDELVIEFIRPTAVTQFAYTLNKP